MKKSKTQIKRKIYETISNKIEMIIPGKVGMATLPEKIIKFKEKLPMLFYPTISRIFISHMKDKKHHTKMRKEIVVTIEKDQKKKTIAQGQS